MAFSDSAPPDHNRRLESLFWGIFYLIPAFFFPLFEQQSQALGKSSSCFSAVGSIGESINDNNNIIGRTRVCLSASSVVELPARHLHFAPQHHRGATSSVDRLRELDGRKREALGSSHRWPELWRTVLISRRVACCPIYSSRRVSRQIVRCPYSRLGLDLTAWFSFSWSASAGPRQEWNTLGEEAGLKSWNKVPACFFLRGSRQPLESALIIKKKKIPLLTKLSEKQESTLGILVNLSTNLRLLLF